MLEINLAQGTVLITFNGPVIWKLVLEIQKARVYYRGFSNNENKLFSVCNCKAYSKFHVNNKRLHVRICLRAFYVTQYQKKRLNDALEFTLTSSSTSKRNMKKFSFLPKSSPAQACRPSQAQFYKTFRHFQNQRGTNSKTMHVEIVGGVRQIFKI